MFYIIEALSGEKLNLRLLDREELSKMNETKALILEILAERGEMMFSARMLQKELKKRGLDTKIDNIRYHANELVKMGFVKKVRADKRLKKLYDPDARYYYKLNDEYVGFYYIYPKNYRQIEQKIIRGRYDILVFLEYDVINAEGDIEVFEFFIFTNTGDTPIEKDKHWFFTEEGFLTFKELEIEAFDNKGNKLKVVPVDSEDPPRKNVYVEIYFDKPVKKNETYAYWYKRKRKGAIALKGDRIYYDANTPAKMIIITVALQREVRGVKRLVSTFKDKNGISGKTSVQPFWYKRDGRVILLWCIPEPIVGSTYTMEWESML